MTGKLLFQVCSIYLILTGNLYSAITKTNDLSMPANTDKAFSQPMGDSTSGYAAVNGINMYYEIHGTGEPLVLIHGGGSTITTTFGNILPLLAKQYKVIAVELQAHGHTSDRGKPSSFEQDADDIAALLAQLTISKAYFFGFSNGGSTALQVAIRHPALVNKLVVVSAIYKREGLMDGFFDGMKNASLNNMPQPLQAAYLAIPGNTKAGLQVMHDRDKMRMLDFKDWPDKDLMSIKAPVLIVNSDKDVVTPQHAFDIANKISHASLMILPGIHGAAIGEVCVTKPGSNIPALTVGMITNFLDDTNIPESK